MPVNNDQENAAKEEQTLENNPDKKRRKEEEEEERQRMIIVVSGGSQISSKMLEKAAKELEKYFNNENECPFNLKPNGFKNDCDNRIKAEFDEGQIETKVENNQLTTIVDGFSENGKELANVLAKEHKVILGSDHMSALALKVTAADEMFEKTLEKSLEKAGVELQNSDKLEEDKFQQNSEVTEKSTVPVPRPTNIGAQG